MKRLPLFSALLFVSLTSIGTGRVAAQSCVAPVGSVIALKADTGKWLGRCSKCQKSVKDAYPDTVTAYGGIKSN